MKNKANTNIETVPNSSNKSNKANKMDLDQFLMGEFEHSDTEDNETIIISNDFFNTEEGTKTSEISINDNQKLNDDFLFDDSPTFENQVFVTKENNYSAYNTNQENIIQNNQHLTHKFGNLTQIGNENISQNNNIDNKFHQHSNYINFKNNENEFNKNIHSNHNRNILKPTLYNQILSSSCTIDLLDFVQKGSVFWKYGKLGAPHFLLFKIDPSLKFLQWFSRNKTPSKTSISLSSFKKMKIGENLKFSKYCNKTLMKRTFCLSLESKEEKGFGDSFSNNSNDSNRSRGSISRNNSSNQRYNQNQNGSMKGEKSNSNIPLRGGILETLNFVSPSCINLVVWSQFLEVILAFNEKMRIFSSQYISSFNKDFDENDNNNERRNLSEEEKYQKGFLGGLIRKIKGIKAQINLPYELASKCYLLYKFEFYFLFFSLGNNKQFRNSNNFGGNQMGERIENNNNFYSVNNANNFNIDYNNRKVSNMVGTKEYKDMENEIKTISKEIQKCNKKLQMINNKISSSEILNVSERLKIISDDFLEIRKYQNNLNFIRVKKIYWLMHAEVMAVGEMIESFILENKEKSGFKLF